MTTEVFTGPFAKARRELRRDEMSDFGGSLPWLGDPSIIPIEVTEFGDPNATPYHKVGKWMLGEIVDWSAKAHIKLNYQGVFDKHDLTTEQRVKTRSMITFLTKESFAPGIDSMCEIFEVVPEVAAREGITDPKKWLEIASQARSFAASFAKNGTNVQGAVRLCLAEANATSSAMSLLPEKLKLDDETGITSVIPIERLIEIAIDVTENFRTFDSHTENVCTALQAPIKGLEGNPTMYDAIWNAYAHVVGTLIYPHYTPATPRPVSTETEEDVYQNMKFLAEQMNELDASRMLESHSLEGILRVLGGSVSEVVRVY